MFHPGCLYSWSTGKYGYGSLCACRANRSCSIAIAVVRRFRSHYTIICHNPIIVNKTNDKDTDICDALLLMIEAIERLILESPCEWMWFHKRF